MVQGCHAVTPSSIAHPAHTLVASGWKAPFAPAALLCARLKQAQPHAEFCTCSANRRGLAGPDAALEAQRSNEHQRAWFDHVLFTEVVPALRRVAPSCLLEPLIMQQVCWACMARCGQCPWRKPHCSMHVLCRSLGIACKGCLGEFDTQAVFMAKQRRGHLRVCAITRDIDLAVNGVDFAWMQRECVPR